MTDARAVPDLLRFVPDAADPDLTDLPTNATAGVKDRADAEAETAALAVELSELQTRLYAQAQHGDRRRVLLLLQGTDASGKDGVVKHVIGEVNPQGVTITSFKKPTPAELEHDFLWRIARAVPEPGQIGIFNRSQYEDVLIVRVHDLVPEPEWEGRYAAINAWERSLVEDGVTLVKVFLHLGFAEQKKRLLDRLDDPSKHWKLNPGDLDERAKWPEYQQAYAAMLQRCSEVPWYVVPADRKWYRNWAVTSLLVAALREVDPQYPSVDLDLAALRARLEGE